jgi:hypothetical protein
MIVKFLSECYGFQEGAVVDLPDDEALECIEAGYAKKATKKALKEAEAEGE